MRYFFVTFFQKSIHYIFRYFFVTLIFFSREFQKSGGQESKNIPKFTSKNRKIAICCILLHFLFIIFKSQWGLESPQPLRLRGPWLLFFVTLILLSHEFQKSVSRAQKYPKIYIQKQENCNLLHFLAYNVKKSDS